MKGGLGSTPTALRLKEEWNRKIVDMALHHAGNA